MICLFQKLHFAHWVKKTILKNFISITWHNLVLLLSPMEEGVTLHFNVFESP